ncbi:MAG: hypothetical protein ACTS3F_09155 [Phycisphaerales bacterium]
MVDARTVVLSTRVDAEFAERIEMLARVSGLTASRLIEQLLHSSVDRTRTVTGEAGSVELRLIGELNVRNDRPVDPDHPGVSLWELDAKVWPRHFFRVVCEYGLDPDDGSSECWLLWRGDEVEQIDPVEYLARERRKAGE